MMSIIISLIISITFTGCECGCNCNSENCVTEHNGGIRSVYVKKKNNYKNIAELQVTCLNKTQDVSIISTKDTSRVTVKDNVNNLYEKVLYGVKKVSDYEITEFYLHEDCIEALFSVCDTKSECSNGSRSKADCHVTCSIYDLKVPQNFNYNDAHFNWYKLYGFSKIEE